MIPSDACGASVIPSDACGASGDTAVPDATGHFGPYGGRFVPEALVAAIDELTAAFESAPADASFRAEFDRLLRDYTGRPSPLTDVPTFSEHAGGARVLLKREDLNHTGSHKINNVLGQALLTQRIGKRRVIAETGAGQHGVATATAARAVRSRVHGLHGRGGHPAAGAQRGPDAAARRRGDSGDDRLAHAQGRHQRGDARLGDQRRDHPLPVRHRRRAAPVPADGARVPAGDRRRGAGAGARAGGPAAGRGRRLRRRRVQRDRHLHRLRPAMRRCAWSASRPAATASTPAGTPRRSPAARRACCTAPGPTCCRTRTARRSSRTRSRPAWTTRASARSTPSCTTSAAPSTAPVTDDEAMAAFALLSPHRGHHPGDRVGARAGRRPGARAGAAGWARSSSSTCPAAATRTSRPRRAYFGLGRRPGAGPLRVRARDTGRGSTMTRFGRAAAPARREAGRVDRLPAGRLPERRRVDRGDAAMSRRGRCRRGGRPVQRPGDGRADDPGGRGPGGAGRGRAPRRAAAVAAVATPARPRW